MPDDALPADADALSATPTAAWRGSSRSWPGCATARRGCPWDIEQDFDSIAPYTIEEAYEVADAIARSDMAELRDELGDLLFQVVYHARMAEEAGAFAFGDVVRAISDKMIRRHPHVFGDESRDKTADQQTARLGARQGRRARPRAGALAGVAAGLPALTRAVKLQNRAARVGFDWPDAGAVLDKIAEETAELVEARDAGDAARVARGIRRPDVRDGQPRPPPRPRPRGRAARRQRQVHPPLRGDRGRRSPPRAARPPTPTLAEMDALWDAAKLAERGT